ncbi:MAG: hypothetical protein ACI97A_003905 [Planctomycetota bacterium]|jgi:hypothetical protein
MIMGHRYDLRVALHRNGAGIMGIETAENQPYYGVGHLIAAQFGWRDNGNLLREAAFWGD